MSSETVWHRSSSPDGKASSKRKNRRRSFRKRLLNDHTKTPLVLHQRLHNDGTGVFNQSSLQFSTCNLDYAIPSSIVELALLVRMLAPLVFPHTHAVCAAFVRETRIDSAGYANVCIFAGNPVPFGKHPQATRSIVDLIHALAQRSIGAGYSAHYCYFTVEITPRVAVYLRDPHPRRAPCHRQRRQTDHNSKDDAPSLHVLCLQIW